MSCSCSHTHYHGRSPWGPQCCCQRPVAPHPCVHNAGYGAYPAYICAPQPIRAHRHHVIVPQEIKVDGSDGARAVVGGVATATATLEYMPSETPVADPGVRLTIVANGATTEWGESPIAPGYHVKTDLPTLSPGARISLE